MPDTFYDQSIRIGVMSFKGHGTDDVNWGELLLAVFFYPRYERKEDNFTF